MRLIASYVRTAVRQGYNYVNQTRELRLLASIGIVVYVLSSVVMGFTFANSLSEKYHEHAPEVFSAWFNRRLTWGIGFIGVVTMLATIATLFQSAQRDELERLRLLPIPDLPFFAMRVLDICMGVMVFFPLLVGLPVVRFFAVEGLPLAHAGALLAGVVLVTLQICFVHMFLAVAAARFVPERLIQNKSALYVALAILGAIFYGIAIVIGRRDGDLSLLAGIEALLPGAILLHSIRGEPAAVWGYLAVLTAVTGALGAASCISYSRLYLSCYDLLMDKLVSDEHVRENQETPAERLVRAASPAFLWLARRTLSGVHSADLPIALIRKELHSILRDPSVHLVLFFALLFVALPGLFFSAREPLLGLQVTWFLGVGTAIVFNAVMGVSSIGREGQGLGNIAVVPVRPDEILYAKACATLALHALLSVPLAAGVLLLPLAPGMRLLGAAYAFVASVATGGALAFLAVGLGAIFPKFDSKNQFLAVNRFGVAIFFGLATLLLASSAAGFTFPVLFGPLGLIVPAALLGIWGFVAGVLYVEGSRRLRTLLALE